MKITRRQADLINEMIREEASKAIRGRDSNYAVDRILMSEAADLTGALEAIPASFESQMMEDASGLRVEYDRKLYAKLSQVIKSITGNNMSPADVMDMVEDFDADAVQEASMELDADITAALDKYCTAITQLAAATQSGFEG